MTTPTPAADIRSRTPLRRIIAYASGEGANSITMNGISAFALLFYVQVLGLSGKWAGIALSVTMLWDAVSDPIMGHITDNTRSRYGRRHPYILAGGILLALSFFFLWIVPDFFKGPQAIFWYLLGINFLVRTAVTIFVVPYVALGFEICTDYEERAKLQSVRSIFNMAMNFLFTAAGWVLFFGDRKGADGAVIDGTTVVSNYRRMGSVLSLAAVGFILICFFSTQRYARDTRSIPGIPGNSLKAFILDMRDIFRDRLAVMVYGFYGVATLGMLLVSQVQMFTYRFFMNLPDFLKTTVHGSTMAGFAIGAFAATPLVKRLDKKPAAAVGVALNILASVLLYIFFIGGVITPQATLRLPEGLPFVGGGTLPLAALVLALGQAMYWAGNGIIVPVSASMIADVSEINKLKNGILKDGSYSAVYSFSNKAACSLGLLMTGLILDWAGIVPEAAVQTAAASKNVARLTFISGPIFAVLGLLIILPYAVNRRRMAEVKAALAVRPSNGDRP